MKTAIIIIPLYKEHINPFELCSLRQCFTVLKSHPIALVCSLMLNIKLYKEEAERCGISLEIERFEPIYFDDIPGYNRLLLSSVFYKRFSLYKHLLIHQTDAYVFRDELYDWCSKAIDYIGAPWFRQQNSSYTTEVSGAGNGGFSLRSVSSSIKMIKRIERLKIFRHLWFVSRLQSLIRFKTIFWITKSLFRIKNENRLNELLFYIDTHEDHYWTDVIATTFADFKVAGIEDALRFSFEVNPSYLYQQNNRQLPFGCHAWQKNEPEFWANYITEFPLI